MNCAVLLSVLVLQSCVLLALSTRPPCYHCATPTPVTPPSPPPYHADFCAAAYRACDFAFEGYPNVPTFDASGKQDTPFTNRIVARNGQVLGVLNTNNIIPEFLFPGGIAKPITYFGSQPFTPTHFKPFSLGKAKGSGIGHQTYHGDQSRIVRHKCVRVFFSTYQVLKSLYKPSVIANINVNRYDNKCVVFRTL